MGRRCRRAGRMKENEKAVRALWKEVNRSEEGRILEKGWKQLKVVSLFAGSDGFELETEEGHQWQMDESALIPMSNGTGEFEQIIAKELEIFGFKDFKREVSLFAGDEGGELLKIDIAFQKERVALEVRSFEERRVANKRD